MSDDLHRGRHRAPAGRHRALAHPQSPRTSLPRLTKPGFLLPTAAAATLVLAATGAHVGSDVGTGPLAATAQNAAGGAAPSASATADVIDRVDPSEQDRAARSSDRAQTGATDATDPTDATDATDATAAGDQVAAEAAAKAQAEAQAAKAAADAQAATKAWVPPIGPGSQLTSGFGMRWGTRHPGQDFAVSVGTPVKALSSGTVIFAGWSGGYGNKVEIQYWDGTVSWYAHNSQPLVAQGDKVTSGQTVSLSGNTGHSTGPHLHVEIHPANGSPVPPIPWLTSKGIMP